MYNDGSSAVNAFMQGLGNANLDPMKDILQGVDAGLGLATKFDTTMRELGPEGAERRRIEMETKKLELENAKLTQELKSIEVRHRVATENDVLKQKQLELKQRLLELDMGTEDFPKVSAALDGLSQIKDARSFTDFLNDPRFAVLANNQMFSDYVRSRAGMLMRSATPEEQVDLARTVEAFQKGGSKELTPLMSEAAQRSIARQSAGSKAEASEVIKAENDAREISYAIDRAKKTHPGKQPIYVPQLDAVAYVDLAGTLPKDWSTFNGPIMALNELVSGSSDKARRLRNELRNRIMQDDAFKPGEKYLDPIGGQTQGKIVGRDTSSDIQVDSSSSATPDKEMIQSRVNGSPFRVFADSMGIDTSDPYNAGYVNNVSQIAKYADSIDSEAQKNIRDLTDKFFKGTNVPKDVQKKFLEDAMDQAALINHEWKKKKNIMSQNKRDIPLSGFNISSLMNPSSYPDQPAPEATPAPSPFGTFTPPTAGPPAFPLQGE